MTARVDGLLAALTREEKLSLVAGADLWTTPGVPRLGVPPLKLTDGPNGARGLDVPGAGLRAACFPCGSALAASFDPALVRRVGAALGEETRSKGAHVLLAPTVNLHRSPLAGRNFECFSEDPLLTARMAVAYVEGVQSRDVLACIKHFVCNDSEFERHTISSEVDERTLHELYLPPFEAAVKEARVGAVMGAYNRVNGTFACEHPRLLTEILREAWGFEGFVVSDWYATQSAAPAAGAGLDLEMPGPPRRFAALGEALEQGALEPSVLDAMVRRLLLARERIGAFERADEPQRAVDRPEHRALAREAAAAGMVLLRNASQTLPLELRQLRTLAVVGPNASASVIQGGGSAQVTPHYAVSALEGIRAACGAAVHVQHERGCSRHRSTPVLDAALLAPLDDGDGVLRTEFFPDARFEGAPLHRAQARRGELTWFGAPAPGVPAAGYAVRCCGTLLAPEDGRYVFTLSTAGRSRLLVGGELVIDDWQPQPGGESFFGVGSRERRGEIALRAGEPQALCIEMAGPAEGSPLGGVRVGCLLPEPPDLLERAVAAARAADAAVVVVGLDAEWETEGRDRSDLSLPGRQAELIAAVGAANPRTVVVLNAGSPVEMPWAERVPAILQLWYPGQELGNALADVLFGRLDPGGRLPTSFPVRLEDSPSFPWYPGEAGRAVYGEGLRVGYRQDDTRGVAPLFPFGHGLSYGRFTYAGLRLDAERIGPQQGFGLRVEVANEGERPGHEVVQCYLHREAAAPDEPAQALAAFAKLQLAPGERREVRLEVPPRALCRYDPAAARFVTAGGRYEVRVGRSSRDLRARAHLLVDA